VCVYIYIYSSDIAAKSKSYPSTSTLVYFVYRDFLHLT